MSLPSDRIKQINLPNLSSNGTVLGTTTYDIVPEMLGKNGFAAELPSLEANATIALTSDLFQYASQVYVMSAISALTYASVGAASAAHTHTYSDVGALSAATHIPNDPVNADWSATSGLSSIKNKPTLGTAASMASTAFRSSGWMPTYADVGALSSSTFIPSVYGDVGAASAAHSHTYSDVGALSAGTYIPSIGVNPATTTKTLTGLTLDGVSYAIAAGGSPVWGSITGTLANQTDLQSALNDKASAGHNHDGRYYSSGDSAYFSSITTSFILGFSALTLSADGPAASIAIGAGSIALSAGSILFNGSALGTAAFSAATAFASSGHNHDGRYYSSGDSPVFSGITAYAISGQSGAAVYTGTLMPYPGSTNLGGNTGSQYFMSAYINSIYASTITLGTSSINTAAFYASTAFASASHTHTDYVERNGDTMTGQLVAQNNIAYTTAQVRNVILSTSEPTSTDGGNGDIWIVYKE